MTKTEPLLEGRVYHIYTHANGNENLFLNDENFNFFLKKYSTHIHPIADTYAYCLMPNHIHLMIRMKTQKQVVSYLQNINQNLQGFKKPWRFGSKTLEVLKTSKVLYSYLLTSATILLAL